MKATLMRSPDTEDIESQIAISCHQMRLLVLRLGGIQLSYWPGGSQGNPIQIRLLQRRCIALHKLTVRPN